MSYLIIIGGLLIIAIGTLVSWFGQSLKSSEELALIRNENNERSESLNQQLKEQEKQIISLSIGNSELLAINNSFKQTIEAQTSLINKLNEETERLKAIGNEQLKTIYYTEELNQEVKAIFIRFKLKESTDFSDLCPMKFGIQFGFRDISKLSFLKIIKDFEVRNQERDRLYALQIYDVSKDDQPKITHSYKDIHKNSRTNSITIQVFVTSEIKCVIRDFHDEKLLINFQKDLLKKIESIQLIVNGWIILDEDFENVDWRIDNPQWLSLIDGKTEMYQPINKGPHDHPPYAQWTINLYNRLPEYSKEWSSTIYFGSIAKGIEVLYR